MLRRERARELTDLKWGWILGSAEDYGSLIYYFSRISTVMVAKVHLDLVQQISDECQVSLVHIQFMNSIFFKLPLYWKLIIKLPTLSNY